MSHDGHIEFLDAAEETRLEEEEAHRKWVEEIESLNWNDSDRAEMLDMYLDKPYADVILDLLNSPKREDMKELILSIKERKMNKRTTEKASESAFWVMASIIIVGFLTLIVIIIA
jgi:hypothetical protein